MPTGAGECGLFGPWNNFWWGTQSTLTGSSATQTYHVPALVEAIGYGEQDQSSSVGTGALGTSDLYLKISWTSNNFVAWKGGATSTYQIYTQIYANGSVADSVTCGAGGTSSAYVNVLTGFRPYDVTTATWAGSGDSQTTVYALGTAGCTNGGTIGNSHTFSSGTTSLTGNMTTATAGFTLTNGDTYNILFWFMAETYAQTSGAVGSSTATACADFSHSGATTLCTKNG